MHNNEVRAARYARSDGNLRRFRMGRLSRRSVIVTGAAQGIGAAYAKAIAAEGGSITVTDIVASDATVNAIREAGGQAIGVVCNIIDAEAVSRMVRAAEEAFGGIQGLVNNAALFATLPK